MIWDVLMWGGVVTFGGVVVLPTAVYLCIKLGTLGYCKAKQLTKEQEKLNGDS